MIYAGIGSRETPPVVLNLMREISCRLTARGWTLRSGGAQGADSAFYEAVAYDSDLPADQIEIYLPWKSFNPDVQDSHVALYEPTVEAMAVGAYYHPAWVKLSQGAKKLIARNSHQILGRDTETPADVVICWTKDGKLVGGTAQAIRIAEARNIPVYNLGNSLTRQLISDIL